MVGLAATGAMSVVMLLVQKRTGLARVAPRHIVERPLESLAIESTVVERAVATVSHFAYGAANGAAFAVIGPRLRGPDAVRGVAYAAALLVASYQAWVPAVGIMPPLSRQRRDRRMELIGGHLVYGVVLGSLSRPTAQA